MLALLDECLPTVLRHELPDHEVRSARFMGWDGLENGELLTHMVSAGFDAFITIDQNLRFQQDLRAADIGVIALCAPSNRLEDLLPLVPEVRSALNRIRPGKIIVVGRR